MRRILGALCAVASIGSITTAGAQVQDTSFTEGNGERVLEQSIDIASSPGCVWRSFTDEKRSGPPAWRWRA